MNYTTYVFQDESGQTTINLATWETVSSNQTMGELCVHTEEDSINVVIGIDSLGRFVCLPEYGIGFQLNDPNNLDYSIACLSRILSTVDASAVAYVLRDYLAKYA